MADNNGALALAILGLGKAGGGESNVFVGTEDTTFAEFVAAYQAGKALFVNYDGKAYQFTGMDADFTDLVFIGFDEGVDADHNNTMSTIKLSQGDT